MQSRLIAPVVSAAAVLTLILGVSVAVRGGGDSAPRPLSLASGGGAEELAAPAAAGMASDSDSRSAGGAGGGVRLDASLPDDPDELRAYDLDGRSDAETVRRLARALGIDAEPTRADGRWTAADKERRLDVEPAGHWSYYPASPECSPDTAVSSDRPYSSCMVIDPVPAEDSGSGTAGSSGGSSGSGASTSNEAAVSDPASGPASCPPNARCALPPAEPAPAPTSDADCPPESCTPAAPPRGEPMPMPEPMPEPDPVPEQTARDAADPIFEALGLRGDVSVMQAGGTAIVVLSPRVDGLRTVGWMTQVEVARDGEVRSGNGWLATAEGADVYPLVSAKSAYDEWAKMFAPIQVDCPEGAECAAPSVGCAAPEPATDPVTSCAVVPPAPEMVVTDVEAGLMLTFEKDAPLLVPAWLFTVRDQPEPFAQLAIEPAYLTPPDDTPRCLLPEGCQEPAPEPEPDPGGGTEPDPGTEPGGRSAFGFERYSIAADGVTLTLGYGESGSCPREGVSAAVKEAPDAVYVVLEENTPPADRACTADYRPAETSVTLEAPLGDRKVVDGTTSEPVERTPAP